METEGLKGLKGVVMDEGRQKQASGCREPEEGMRKQASRNRRAEGLEEGGDGRGEAKTEEGRWEQASGSEKGGTA